MVRDRVVKDGIWNERPGLADGSRLGESKVWGLRQIMRVAFACRLPVVLSCPGGRELDALGGWGEDALLVQRNVGQCMY